MNETKLRKMGKWAGYSALAMALALLATFVHNNITGCSHLTLFPTACTLVCLVSFLIIAVVITALIVYAIEPLVY